MSDATCVAGAGCTIFQREDDWQPLGRQWIGGELGAMGSVWRREPLALSVSRDQISASLNVLYRARVGIIGGRDIVSCGYDEAPRQLALRLVGEIRLAPEWYVDPNFAVSLEPGNACRATLLNLNVTDWFVEPMRDALQAEVEDVKTNIRQMTSVGPGAAAIWAGLSAPIAIGPDTWLEINPVGVAAGPLRLTDDGRYLAITVALKASPRVKIGSRPASLRTTLPAPSPGDVSPAFNVKVRGLVTYQHASATLTDFLKAKRWSRTFRIEKATVSGSGTKVVVALKIRGLLSGTLYLFGTPHFLARTDGRAGGSLLIDDIDYTLETKSFLARIGNALFQARIRQELEANSRWDVTEQLEAGLASLTSAVNRDLSPQARMTGRLAEFGPGEVRVGPNGLEAWYRIGGKVEVVVDPF